MPGKVTIIAGHFGSGKTEFALNLAARRARESGRRVHLVDLDFVNPYFRSRRFHAEMAAQGVDLVQPLDRQVAAADLPSLSAGLLGLLGRRDEELILETGGDPIGARVLGTLQDRLGEREAEMGIIFNCFRPETASPEDVRAMTSQIEATSGLVARFLISNCHLKEATDDEVLREGLAFTRQVDAQGPPLRWFCHNEQLTPPRELQEAAYPLFPLRRFNLYCYEPGPTGPRGF